MGLSVTACAQLCDRACKARETPYSASVRVSAGMSDMDRALLGRLDDLEHKLNRVLEHLDAQEVSDWVDRKAACALLGVSDRHLMTLIERGVIHGDAIRNVGTVRKSRYRFHRKRALS